MSRRAVRGRGIALCIDRKMGPWHYSFGTGVDACRMRSGRSCLTFRNCPTPARVSIAHPARPPAEYVDGGTQAEQLKALERGAAPLDGKGWKNSKSGGEPVVSVLKPAVGEVPK